MTASSKRGKMRPPGVGIRRRFCAVACAITIACGLAPAAALGDEGAPAADEGQTAQQQTAPAPAAQPTATPSVGAAPAANAFAISTEELPHATPGTAFTANIETAGAPANVTWKLEPASNETLPAWLSITPNGARATLSGTPAAKDIGLNKIVVTATDTADPTNAATKEFVLSVYADPPLNVSGTPNVDWGYIPETATDMAMLIIKSEDVTLSGKATGDLKITPALDVRYTRFSNVDADSYTLIFETGFNSSDVLLFEGDNKLSALYYFDDDTPSNVTLGGRQGSSDSVTFTDGVLVAGNLMFDELNVRTDRTIEAGGSLNVIGANVVARQALIAGDTLAITDGSFVKTQRLEAANELSISTSAMAIEQSETNPMALAGRAGGLPDGIAVGSNLYVHDAAISIEAAGDTTTASFPVPAAVYAGGHATFSGATLFSAQCTDGAGGAWGIFAAQGLHFDLVKDASVDALGRAGGGKSATFGMGTNGGFEFAKNNAVIEPVGGAPVKSVGNVTAVGLAGTPALHATVGYMEPAAPKPDPKPKEDLKLVPTDGGKLAKTGDPAAPLTAAAAAAATLGGAAGVLALLRRRAAKR